MDPIVVEYGGGRKTIDGYYCVCKNGCWEIWRDDVRVCVMLVIRDVFTWIAQNPISTSTKRRG